MQLKHNYYIIGWYYCCSCGDDDGGGGGGDNTISTPPSDKSNNIITRIANSGLNTRNHIVQISVAPSLLCSLIWLLLFWQPASLGHGQVVDGGPGDDSTNTNLNVNKLPSWCDFELFMKKYNKVYRDDNETDSRRSIFMDKCLQVLESKINYRLGLSTWAAGINQFSDRTTGECESLFVHTPVDGDDYEESAEEGTEGDLSSNSDTDSDTESPKSKLKTENFVVKEIEQMLKKALDSGDKYRVGAIRAELEGLPIEAKWGHEDANSDEGHQVSRKKRNKKNNKDKNINKNRIRKRKRKRKRDRKKRRLMRERMLSRDDLDRPVYEIPNLEGHKAVNWSSHECFHQIYDQKYCSQCYVMATTSLAEFYKCAENEPFKQRKFSKKYVLNCAQNYSPHILGCHGGSLMETLNFIVYAGTYTELGWKRRRDSADQNKTYTNDCPIDQHEVPLDKWGEIKLQATPKEVWPAEWFQHIHSGPLIGIVSLPSDVAEYEQGVHFGEGCQETSDWHSMLLVGYGRENGLDYWLFRNSWGPHWGHYGHLKLSTDIPDECLFRGARLIRQPWHPFKNNPQQVIDYKSLLEASKEPA